MIHRARWTAVEIPPRPDLTRGAAHSPLGNLDLGKPEIGFEIAVGIARLDNELAYRNYAARGHHHPGDGIHLKHVDDAQARHNDEHHDAEDKNTDARFGAIAPDHF